MSDGDPCSYGPECDARNHPKCTGDSVNYCARSACFGTARNGALCARCHELVDSAIVIAVCGGMSLLIIVAVKVWGLV